MTDPSLPPELIDRIIDYLHDDKAALSAVSRTCKALVTTSRLHLFNRISLWRKNAGGFLRLLTRRPEIGALVEDLTLTEEMTNVFGIRWVAPSISTLTHHLPNITKLSLSMGNEHWNDLGDEARAAFLSGFTQTKQLIVRDMQFSLVRDATAFLSSFPLLSALSWGATIEQYPSRQSAPQSCAPTALSRLSSLHFPECDGELLPWLVSITPTIPVETLHLGTIHPPVMHDVSKFLETLGPRLKHVSLDMSLELGIQIIHNPSLYDVLSFAHNTSLRAIRIGQPNAGSPPGALYNWIINVLSGIPSAVEEVVIELRLAVGAHQLLDEVDWTRWDTVLSRSPWRGSLRYLEFRFVGLDRSQKVPLLKALLRGLPSLDGRNILAVT